MRLLGMVGVAEGVRADAEGYSQDEADGLGLASEAALGVAVIGLVKRGALGGQIARPLSICRMPTAATIMPPVPAR